MNTHPTITVATARAPGLADATMTAPVNQPATAANIIGDDATAPRGT